MKKGTHDRTYEGKRMKRVRGWSLFLLVVMLVTLFPDPIAYATPAKPSGLTAVSLGSSSIQLAWDVSGADYYRVYFGTSTSDMSLYATVYITSCAAKSLRCNTRYFFKVRAFSSGAASPYSLTVNARTTVGIAAPSFLTAYAVSSSQINLGWPTVSGADGYMVYFAASSSGPYSALFATTHTYYYDVGLTSNTRKYYKVRAINSSGEGYFSAWASARTCPPAVTGLHATALSAGGVRLNWNAASGANRYRIYCASSSTGTYIQVGETSNRYFTHATVSSNTDYYYKVMAVSPSGLGPESGFVHILTLPAVPTGLEAVPWTISKILLRWFDVGGAVKYAVYRSSSSNGHFKKIGEAMGASYTSTGMKDGTRYYFRISAVNAGDGESAKSTKVSCKPYSITGTPLKPDFKLINYTSIGVYYRAAFGHNASPFYPSTMEPRFKFYYGSSQSSMKTSLHGVKTVEAVIGGDYFTMNVLPGRTMWYGFRACFGSHAGPMQMFKIAALSCPTGLNAGPSGGAGVVEFGWNTIPEAARYNVYVSTAAPNLLRSWANNKATLTAAHSLSFKGYTNDTVYYVTNVPNHSTLYYIVVPANAAGVEGWFFNTTMYTFNY